MASNFAVGDIVKERGAPHWPCARVTEITERGFKYELLEHKCAGCLAHSWPHIFLISVL